MRNKRGILGLILFVIVLLVVGFWVFVQIKGIDLDFDKNTSINGLQNNSCMKVQTTCCSCAMGGEEKCVNQSEAKRYGDKLKECPKDIICAAVYGCQNITCGEKC